MTAGKKFANFWQGCAVVYVMKLMNGSSFQSGSNALQGSRLSPTHHSIGIRKKIVSKRMKGAKIREMRPSYMSKSTLKYMFYM